MQQKTLIVIVGPTAIGKTALAIDLAKDYQTEIISADSRQFFKEMSIGTAKPTTEELRLVRHHFIDSHSILDYFSTGDFELEALKVLNDLYAKHDVVICVGGSGLYINALCDGLDELPDTDLNIRTELNKLLQDKGIDAIRNELQSIDPAYYKQVDRNNPQRMIRGIEMYRSNGVTLSSLLTRRKKIRPFRIVKIGLNIDRSTLYDRINKRVDQMISLGLLKEVENLFAYRDLNALKTVGYSEIFEYLRGNYSLEDAISRIKQNTRRYAKRQLTWFNKDPQITWFQPEQRNEIRLFLKEKIA